MEKKFKYLSEKEIRSLGLFEIYQDQTKCDL